MSILSICVCLCVGVCHLYGFVFCCGDAIIVIRIPSYEGRDGKISYDGTASQGRRRGDLRCSEEIDGGMLAMDATEIFKLT